MSSKLNPTHQPPRSSELRLRPHGNVTQHQDDTLAPHQPRTVLLAGKRSEESSARGQVRPRIGTRHLASTTAPPRIKPFQDRQLTRQSVKSRTQSSRPRRARRFESPTLRQQQLALRPRLPHWSPPSRTLSRVSDPTHRRHRRLWTACMTHLRLSTLMSGRCSSSVSATSPSDGQIG